MAETLVSESVLAKLVKKSSGALFTVALPPGGRLQILTANDRRIAFVIGSPQAGSFCYGPSEDVFQVLGGQSTGLVKMGSGFGDPGSIDVHTIFNLFGLINQPWFAHNGNASFVTVTVLEVFTEDRL